MLDHETSDLTKAQWPSETPGIASPVFRTASGRLGIRFEFLGEQWVEETAMPDTPELRPLVEALHERVQAAIAAGTFDYFEHFPTSESAAAAVALMGLQSGGAALTVREGADRWLASDQADTEHGGVICRMVVRNYVLPQWGQRRVATITPSDLEQMHKHVCSTAGRQAETVAARTVNHTMATITRMLNWICRDAGISKVFVAPKPYKFDWFSGNPILPEHLPRLIQVTPPEFREYVLIRALTGMSAAEAHGLRWKNVDLSAREVRVAEQMAKLKTSQVATQRQRSIPIGQAVVDAFRTLHARRADPSDGETLVLLSTHGRPMNTNNFANRVWQKMCAENAFLKGASPRDLRYTAVIAFIREGRPLEEIIKIMGYATVDLPMRLFQEFGRPPEVVSNEGGCIVRRVSSDINIDPSPSPGRPRRVISTFQRDAIVQLPLDEAVEQTGLSAKCVAMLRPRFKKVPKGRRPQALTSEQREMLTYLTLREFAEATGFSDKVAEYARKRFGITAATVKACRAERAAKGLPVKLSPREDGAGGISTSGTSPDVA